jgi:hypothetical protein
MMKETLDNIRKQIMEKELSIIRYSVNIEKVKKDLELIELKVLNEITQEVDDKGKAIFTNETKRKSELYKRLDEDGEYVKFDVDLRKYKSYIATLIVEIQDLKYQFKTYEILCLIGELK